jgi:ParB family chromosome partitioning protein
VARRSGLGKGLGALIPTDEEGGDSGLLREVPLDAITPNPRQPRKQFDDDSLAELAESIAELGVLQPILVRELDDGDLELIAGERRWRASQLAGRETIPAIVRQAEEVGSLEQALVENLHRDDLHPLEEAAAYQALLEEFGLTQEQVAQRVGRSRSAVANTVRLLQLPAPVQALVAVGKLSPGHARALLATPDHRFQEELAGLVVETTMTVRQLEELIRTRDGEPDATGPGGGPASPPSSSPSGPPATADRPAALLELEELLAARLDTRVHVHLGAKKGRVEIEFADLEDLERIYRVMSGP